MTYSQLDGTTLSLRGQWNVARIAEIDAELGAAALPSSPVVLDGARLEALDTATALALLVRLAAAGASIAGLNGMNRSHARVLETVRTRMDGDAPASRRRGYRPLAAFGFAAVKLGWKLHCHLEFLGRCVAALGELARHPARLRWKELAAQLQHVCIEAIPVVALVTFLIGMVLAYLFGMQAEKYDASIFVVDAVAVGVSREIAPLLAAVIMAGRSGSAFTAQIGTMRLTEEIDALRTLGLSPMQVLVLPRLLASVFALPMLVFIGDVAALAGAMAISGPLLDISPLTFIGRVDSQLAFRHVAVGLAKGAVFGAVIALIGSRAGMTVKRDARSIGISTTSTVVQAIVWVVLLDALFAVLLQELGI
jgi:phospholipid/cholesterol/gamma-HCH transport system permease protein